MKPDRRRLRAESVSPDPPACGFVWSPPCHSSALPCDRDYKHSHGRCACGVLIRDHPHFQILERANA